MVILWILEGSSSVTILTDATNHCQIVDTKVGGKDVFLIRETEFSALSQAALLQMLTLPAPGCVVPPSALKLVHMENTFSSSNI